MEPPFDRRRFLIDAISSQTFVPKGAKIRLKIGGIRIDWTTPSPHSFKILNRVYGEYRIADEDLSLPQGELFSLPFTTDSMGSMGSTLWDDPDPEFDFREESVVQRDFVAKRKGTRAVALLAPDLEDAVHNCLRWFLPKYLLSHSSFLLHGAAVVKNGLGYVFFGQSGAGKSTTVDMISQADPESTVIGDDVVILHFDQKVGEARVITAPLGRGDTRVPPPDYNVPLAGLYPIQQHSTHKFEALSLSERVSALLGSAMTTKWDYETDARFDLAAAIAMAPINFNRIYLKKDPDFWPLILTQRMEKNP